MKYPDKELIIDCDGVLADFDQAAYYACKGHSREGYRKYVKNYPAGSWDMPAAMGVSAEDFWKHIDGTNFCHSLDFWRYIPAYPRARGFYKELCKLAPVVLCTQASHGIGFWSGRAEWLSRVLDIKPSKLPLVIMRGHGKFNMANSGSVLVDDNDNNCKEWAAFGGKSVLFPRRWNAAHAEAKDYGPKKIYDLVLLRVEEALNEEARQRAVR